MTLVAQDGEDVPNILASFDEAATQPILVAIVRLFATFKARVSAGCRVRFSATR